MTESPFMTDGPAFEARAFERGQSDVEDELDEVGGEDGEELEDEELDEDDELDDEDEDEELDEDEEVDDEDEDEDLDDDEELEDEELEDEAEVGALGDDTARALEGDLDEDDELDADDEDEELESATSRRRPEPGNLRLDDDFAAPGNRTEGGAARAVLEHIARSIVDEPDAVVVEVAPARSGVKLSLHVAPGDMGRIIGRRGRVAQALRTVVRAAAASEGGEAVVDIVD